MSARKLLGALALGCALTGGLVTVPVTAAPARQPLTLEDVQDFRAHLGSLLPATRLSNDVTSHYLHFKDTLKAVVGADYSMFGKDADKVNFRKGWHPKAYSTMHEDKACLALGTLSSFGHFTMLNANIPEMKENAKSILQILIKISEDTQLRDFTADLNGVLQAVSDPAFNGGPSATLEKFDEVVMRLGNRIEDTYSRDGFWYFAAGMTLGGVHAIPPKDLFHAPYFRDALSHLYNRYPSTGLSFEARNYMARLLRTNNYALYSVVGSNDLAKKALWAIYSFPGKS